MAIKTNFKITPALHKHLQDTHEALSEIGKNVSQNAVKNIKEFEDFFSDKDNDRRPVVTALEATRDLGSAVSALRLLLRGEFGNIDNMLIAPEDLFQAIKDASKDQQINTMGQVWGGSTDVSLEHLYNTHKNEIETLLSSLQQRNELKR